MQDAGKGSKINKNPIFMVIAVLVVLTAGLITAGLFAGKRQQAAETAAEPAIEEPYESGFIIDEPGKYDSEDTAVVKSVDAAASRITLMNIETGRYYTLAYDGTTIIEDKYGEAMAMSQIAGGDIVDVTFLKEKKTLTGMRISDSAWVLENVKKYSFHLMSNGAEVGDGNYHLAYNPVVVSEGQEIRLEDIVSGDIVSVRGVGNNIYSVVVETGHGYLRLSNDEYLKGGWIEVGQSVIQEITEDMMLLVPEGTYKVHLTANGIDLEEEVTIVRNQETVLDVTDVKPEEPKAGKVIFTVSPGEAMVTIDGKETDISSPVLLEYGLHQLKVEALGYETLRQYIKVEDPMVNIGLSLDVEKEISDKDEDQESVSGNSISGSAKIYIDNPTDVEVYLDNVYIGISPLAISKTAGRHTITLRKNGYVTKSYTVEVDETTENVTYSFTNLVREDGTTSTTTTNTTSSTTNKNTTTTNKNNSSSNSSNSSGSSTSSNNSSNSASSNSSISGNN